MDEHASEIERLIAIMALLRAPEGCPWDRKQTNSTLKPYLLEETYELLEALDNGNSQDIRDELGDLLLQVVFLARINEEQGLFDFNDIARSISDKLVRRHPHVFADANAADHARRWEEIKQQERQERGKEHSLAGRIPKNLPALKTATKIAKKTDQISPSEALDKLEVSIRELKQNINVDKETSKLRGACAEFLYAGAKLMSTLGFDAEDILREKTVQLMSKIDD